MAYGYIQTTSNVARQLKELNRDYYGRQTWKNMYSNVDFQRQIAINDLTTLYNEDVAKAYASAFAQKSIVANSDLGTGYKEQLDNSLDTALQEAFNTYRRNYLTDVNSVNDTAAVANAEIDELLEQESQNYVDYDNATYAYLEYLYNLAFPDDDVADEKLSAMFANDNWSKYLVNEDGQTRLMTQEEIRANNYDLDEFGQGTINRTGKDYYDQMLNGLSQYEGGKYSFNKWLAEENPELYQWSQSGNPFNYTQAGTNAGSFKASQGLESTDDLYSFTERFGGMTDKDFIEKAQPHIDSITKINNTGTPSDTKSNLAKFQLNLVDLRKYVQNLELPESTKNAYLDSINELLDTVIANYDGVYYLTREHNKGMIDDVGKQYYDLLNLITKDLK